MEFYLEFYYEDGRPRRRFANELPEKSQVCPGDTEIRYIALETDYIDVDIFEDWEDFCFGEDQISAEELDLIEEIQAKYF